ncbi:MAG: SpoIID/LytB domain-containing protein [Bacteriovorax sp.]|jgi:stage II sporulation protein D|nr:SpoIID/LytB domain-containing protein [Bacteriovorax sp.]
MLKLILIILFYCTFEVALSSEIPVISVRVGKSLRNILVTGLDLKRHLLFNNDVKSYTGKKTVKFNCETYTTLNKQRNKPILLATLESPTGLLSYGNDKYLGMFKVITNAKGDSCDIVNEIPMEAYISSLLTKEMNPKWPIEALKAQAVAARSYALHKMQTQQVTKELGNLAYYDLESSEKHQVGGNFFDATETTNRASLETMGEVLTTEKGKIDPIFFHSKCGGRTLRPDQVWQNKEEGYQSVNCPFCHDIGPKSWNHFITRERLKSFFIWASAQGHLKESLRGELKSIVLVPDNIDKYTVNFYVNERPFIIEKTALKKFFGRFIFPSNTFSVAKEGDGIAVYGEGLGHGVGLCQMGSFAMATRGWSYKKILSHYFPGHVLKKMY